MNCREQKKIFKCDLCGLKFKSKKALTIHKKKRHNWLSDREKYGVECKICGAKFLSLKNHIKTHNISVEEYEKKYGTIELSNFAKENYSKQNRINGLKGIEKRRIKLKNNEYRRWYGKQLSNGINNSEKAIEARRQNMIKLNKSNEQRAKASERLKKKWREDGWNEKSHAWQQDKEKLKKVLSKSFENANFSSSSSYETSLKEWLSSLDLNFKANDRIFLDGDELDILLYTKKLAVEFDGLYWHSDKFKDKNYHLNKTRKCEEKGVQLIHIFEDEWVNKQDIVKARLKNLLGLNSERIGARKCIIKEIDSKVKNQFLDKYHIQGSDKSSVRLGAYYKNELVGVMTFGKARIFMNKKAADGSWELIRFATINDTSTPGLASKMFKYFERNYKPKVVESFADKRWSQGNLYEQLGFTKIRETKPNYWYAKRGFIRYHRYKFRKSELKNFDNYSPNKTEFEIMDEAGWYRIYDCGSIKYIKNIA